ncbi:hypothetical protein [Segetibacter aerophilus]|uniref:Uncharacterized protein n=1 Tax=Segetibacter aerophilus TaxID=670293 RepID=A0A512BJF5_9BACT|nr:hypothetical protein [Segetibacter aerophilus]GEO12015.1 hypothetical protein SAE01_45110 [Segetibacter aerophilus]
MEPEMVAFLRRIGKSLTIAFCWLAITATAAIKGDNAFIGDHINLGNILFYVWLVISIIILIIIYKRMWFSKSD